MTIPPRFMRPRRFFARHVTPVLGPTWVALCCVGCPATDEPNESWCGDGIVTSAEQCDDGTDNGSGFYGSCAADCTLGAFCGDGIIDELEECDDGDNNGAGYTWCAAGCMHGPFCGDGILDELEECDDGNGHSGDGCDMGCQVEVGFVCIAGQCVPEWQ